MEAFVLISINEKKGSLLSAGSMLTYGLAGIAEYELLKAGRISFDGKSIMLVSASRTGNIFLDEAIDFLSKKQKPYKVKTLTRRMAGRVRRFTKRVLERLEDNGILRIEQNRFLGLIPYNRYTVTRINEQKKLVNDIREIIRNGDKHPEADKAFLISVLSACDVLKKLFERTERKQLRDSLGMIARADYFETLDGFGIEVHKAVKAAIAAAQAAAA